MKILIVDDHSLVRRGIKQVLEEEPEITVLHEAQDAGEALKCIREDNWDLVILDISLPDRNGLEVLEELKHIKPDLPVLILSVYSEEQYAIRAIRTGATGYINKRGAPGELVNAVRKIKEGGKYITPAVAEKLASSIQTGHEKQLHETLSNREFQVLCMIAAGKKVKQISRDLFISERTVRTYRTRILEKMRMKTNIELARYALKNHLVE